MLGMSTVLLLVAVAGCADDLANNPQLGACDEELTFNVVTVPVEVQYDVSATGPAVVRSVTYTTPTGEQQVMNPADPFPSVVVTFTAPTSGRIRVQGEAATGGEIGVAYTFLPPQTQNDLALCVG